MKVLAAMAGVILLALAPLAAAQQKAAQPLETRIEQRKVARAADGAESLVSAEAVKPGDVIEYAVTYRNTGKPALTKLEATLPIPAETEYVPGSARPANAKASTDGRAFSDLPLKRTVKRNGVEVEETVPVGEYRFLRWYPGDLAGEKAVTYTARVRVTDIRTSK